MSSVENDTLDGFNAQPSQSNESLLVFGFHLNSLPPPLSALATATAAAAAVVVVVVVAAVVVVVVGGGGGDGGGCGLSSSLRCSLIAVISSDSAMDLCRARPGSCLGRVPRPRNS